MVRQTASAGQASFLGRAGSVIGERLGGTGFSALLGGAAGELAHDTGRRALNSAAEGFKALMRGLSHTRPTAVRIHPKDL